MRDDYLADEIGRLMLARYDDSGSVVGLPMRQVGRRRECEVVAEASGLLLAEGARFNETISKLARTTYVPKGIYRFKSHEEANRHELDCLALGMGQLVSERR
jgi:hypothetical protein